jgi:hypothetical protein
VSARWVAVMAILLLAASALACQARPGAQPAAASELQEVTLDVPTLL